MTAVCHLCASCVPGNFRDEKGYWEFLRNIYLKNLRGVHARHFVKGAGRVFYPREEGFFQMTANILECHSGVCRQAPAEDGRMESIGTNAE